MADVSCTTARDYFHLVRRPQALRYDAANDLVRRIIYWLPPDVFLPILGWWEVAIGVCLLFRPLLRLGLLLLFLQMPGTFLPFVIVPERCFERFPFVLTLEGQYILKNLIIISAALVIGGTVHPGPMPAPKTPKPKFPIPQSLCGYRITPKHRVSRKNPSLPATLSGRESLTRSLVFSSD